MFKKMMIWVVAFGLYLVLNHTAFAATYYVRTDGGTFAQCNGTTNAPYPGSGTNQACAFNHPAWALGTNGTPGIMVGGDTLIIDDTDHSTGGQAQYKIGYGMPNANSGECSSLWSSYDCTLNTVPSGPDAAHPTRLLGIGYNSGCGKKPQLWGSDGAYQVLNLSGSSNVDMECMEVTDHSNCGFRVGNPVCQEGWGSGSASGPWGRNGIYAQGGSNFSFVNMDVHGMSNRGFLMGGINSVTFSYVNMDGNYMSNWDGDVGESGTTSYNSGAIVLDHVKNRFAGCSEAYPRSLSFNPDDYSNCTDQNDNPAGYGDGLGMYTTGGNWVVTDSEFSHNTQDGLDLLYHDGTGSITIQRSLFEGNDGNQIKVTSPNTDIENSVVVSNCSYLIDTGKVKNTSSFISCRAGGDAIVMTPATGGTYKIYNSSIYSAGNSDVLVYNRINTCNGTEKYTFRNNIYSGNGTASLYIDQLGGSCANPPMDTDYSIIDNVSNGTCPSGSHNKCSTDPKWYLPINLTADSNLPNMYLQSDSPAVGTAEVLSGISSLDFNSSSRGSMWDMGAIQNVTPTSTSTTSSSGSTLSTSTSTGPTTTTSSGGSTTTTINTSLTPTIKIISSGTSSTGTGTVTSGWGTVVTQPAGTSTSTTSTSPTTTSTTPTTSTITTSATPTTSGNSGSGSTSTDTTTATTGTLTTTSAGSTNGSSTTTSGWGTVVTTTSPTASSTSSPSISTAPTTTSTASTAPTTGSSTSDSTTNPTPTAVQTITNTPTASTTSTSTGSTVPVSSGWGTFVSYPTTTATPSTITVVRIV